MKPVLQFIFGIPTGLAWSQVWLRPKILNIVSPANFTTNAMVDLVALRNGRAIFALCDVSLQTPWPGTVP